MVRPRGVHQKKPPIVNRHALRRPAPLLPPLLAYISSGVPKRKCMCLLVPSLFTDFVFFPSEFTNVLAHIPCPVVSIGDGYFPCFTSSVATINRKKRRVIVDRLRGHLPGAAFLSVLLLIPSDLFHAFCICVRISFLLL